MTNLALAPDVKCFHAEAAIDKDKARKYGLSCDNDRRGSRMSIASALAWLDQAEDFSKLSDKDQDKVRCAARDLERVIDVNWVCPPEVETEKCDASLSCGNIQLVDVETGECVLDAPVSPSGTIGYMLPASEPSSGIDLYALGIIDKTDARYYTKSEIDRKVSTQFKTYLLDSSGQSAVGVTAPVNPPGNAKSGDIAIETFNDAIIFWKYDGGNWIQESKHTFPKGNDTRVIDQNATWLLTDDLVVFDTSGGDVVYTLPGAPADNTEVSFMAYNLDNSASVDPNGATINGAASQLFLTNVLQVYKLRYSAALNTWLIL
jgi:hypothetical protein